MTRAKRTFARKRVNFPATEVASTVRLRHSCAACLAEIFESPNARQEKICSAAHSNKLRHLHQALAYFALLRNGEGVGERTARDRLTVAEQWIALLGEAVEFCPRHPCVLHELKLALDVGVERNEVQTALGIAGRRGFDGFSG